MSFVIAIDGPSGSGKSSVSRAVAQRLGYAYLDTGAMYRALTWWCREQGTDLADTEAVAAASRTLPLDMITDPTAPGVRVDGHELEPAIREPAIAQVVSQVATNPGVRANMQARQRDLISRHAQPGVVAEGRDITTVVAPDADLRILLTADPAARVRRRSGDLGGKIDDEAVSDQVIRRDQDDSTVSNFSEAADGVHHIDSTAIDLQETVALVLGLVQARVGACGRGQR